MRRVLRSRARHRVDRRRSLLALELVDGADTRSGWEPLPEQVHLGVVRGHHEDVVHADAPRRVPIGPLPAQQLLEYRAHGGSFLGRLDLVADMGHRDEARAVRTVDEGTSLGAAGGLQTRFVERLGDE